MPRTVSRRQGVRRVILLVSFIAFPVTMNYFSPYLAVDGASHGILNASLVVFASMFAGSLVLGRLWCGWVCPAAGVQEPLLRVNARRVGRRADWVKWAIWLPWVALIVTAVVRAGGFRSADLLYGTVGGISVAGDADRPIIAAYATYFLVVLLFFGLALALGRRAGCHTVCWMAPFMIAGRWICNAAAWPSLRLAVVPSACKGCDTCTTGCPMSLDVQAMVAARSMEDAECLLCGTCVDACAQRAIRYSFSTGRPRNTP
jgi:ferredoxin-type protein NapH